MSPVSDFTVDPIAVIRLIQGNLIDRYPPEAIIKELIQNADDAGASRVVIGFAPDGLEGADHPLLRGPAVFVWNDALLNEIDATNLRKFGSNAKYGEKTCIGKFGLGLKSVFHLCEAFFFVTSGASRSGYADPNHVGLLNPWYKIRSQWNEVTKTDLERLAHKVPSGGSDWFALWLPLRTKDQADGHCIHRAVLELADANRLLARDSLVSLVPALPLLRSVRHVEPSGAASYRLAEDADRSAFSEWADREPAELQNRCGTGRIAGPDGTIRYAFAERWVPGLLALREKSWPHSPNERGEAVPDKAAPHAAVVLGWHDAPGTAGLDVREAVFLPLPAPADRDTPPPKPKFTLLAHGCFFLDSGRKGFHTGGDGIAAASAAAAAPVSPGSTTATSTVPPVTSRSRAANSATRARSRSLAAVASNASRWPSASTATWAFDPFRFSAPSYPARPPPSGVDWRVRPSRTAAVGWAPRPSTNRRIIRRSWAMSSNTPAATPRRAGW
jgi:hypothetical protein